MTTEQPPTTGMVPMHFLVSLDGFVAGPGHDMGFMDRTTVRDVLHREYIEWTGRPGRPQRVRRRHRRFPTGEPPARPDSLHRLPGPVGST